MCMRVCVRAIVGEIEVVLPKKEKKKENNLGDIKGFLARDLSNRESGFAVSASFFFLLSA